MKYLLILLLVIIVGLTFYIMKYRKLKEGFQASLVKLSQTDTCNFVPWGHSREGCINRCASDEKSFWGGDSCDLQSCRKICDDCEDKSLCKWKTVQRRDAPIIREQMPPKIKIRVVPGDTNAIVFWENINNDSNKNTAFIIKYFKTYSVDQGVSVETVSVTEDDIKKNKRNYRHTIKGLENNETYSVVVFASNTYSISEASNVEQIKPTMADKILSPV